MTVIIHTLFNGNSSSFASFEAEPTQDAFVFVLLNDNRCPTFHFKYIDRTNSDPHLYFFDVTAFILIDNDVINSPVICFPFSFL
jgi:hypothetical protein